ncbi:MAG TPA: family 16 glycoside hydrolase [Fibrobacteria bacterium]|nr:family 16 glycoside hydrolase [Fibrobacteria bacterium]
MKKAILILLAASAAVAKPEWKPLYDGKTKTGWHIVPAGSLWNFTNADSAFSYVSDAGTQYSMVFTDKADYDQFTVKYQYRLKAGCSGFFFRSQEKTTTERVAGIQVEAKFNGGLKEVGSLYCFQCLLNGAGTDNWVPNGQHDDAYSAAVARPADQFQDVILTVKFPYVYVNVNGHQAIGGTQTGDRPAYKYDKTPVINEPGRFGLQVHAGQQHMNVAFKNIMILQGCNDSTSANYDGKFVAGSTTQPAVYQDNGSCAGVATKGEIQAKMQEAIGTVKSEGGTLSVKVSHRKAHSFDIISLHGKVVFSGSAPGPFEYRISNPLKPGVYFARISSGSYSANKRILVP